MPHWAIVAGIDGYRAPRLALKGAVRDALAMYGWLTGPDGPAVDPGRVLLLLSPGPASPQPPPGVSVQPAHTSEIIRTVLDVAGKAAGPDDRLFFHFSGHGLTGTFGSDVLLGADFEDVDTTPGLGFGDILDYFKTSQFNCQFFFVDACRNFPYAADREYAVNPGFFPRIPPNRTLRPSAEQFVFAATSRGIKANEDQSRVNDERGVFTEALLAGLRGAGVAKRFNPATLLYEVTPERLQRHLAEAVQEKIRSLGLAEPGRFYQTPTLRGEHICSPILASFPEEKIPPASVSFTLSPPEAEATASVRVSREVPIAAAGPPVSNSTVLTLKQREYRIEAMADGYQAEPAPLELYSSRTVSLKLHGVPEYARAPGSVPASAAATGGVDASAWDPISVLYLLGGDGSVVEKGAGRLKASNLAPGAYTVRLVSPEGRTVEQPAFVRPGETEYVRIPAPPLPRSRGLDEVMLRGEMFPTAVNTLQVSETLGAPQVAAPKVSSILAMAAGAAVLQGSRPAPRRLLRLGLAAARKAVGPESPAGFQLLLADETSDDLLSTGIRVWKYGELMPLAPARAERNAALSTVAEFALVAEAGQHLLALDLPTGDGSTSARRPLQIFSLPILPERVTTVILHRNQRGAVAAYYFFPRMGGGEGEILLQRRLEAAQRFYRSGNRDAVLEVLSPAGPDGDTGGNREEYEILAKHQDPMAELLSAYSALWLAQAVGGPRRETYRQVFAAAVRHLEAAAPSLCDAALLRAEECLLDNDETGAELACRQALDNGLPLLESGVRRLHQLTLDLAVRHQYGPLLERAAEKRWKDSPVTVWDSAITIWVTGSIRVSDAVFMRQTPIWLEHPGYVLINGWKAQLLANSGAAISPDALKAKELSLYHVRRSRSLDPARSIVSQDVRDGDVFVLIRAEGLKAGQVSEFIRDTQKFPAEIAVHTPGQRIGYEQLAAAAGSTGI